MIEPQVGKVKTGLTTGGFTVIIPKKKLHGCKSCFLEDVRVIWCNSLGDSHFQTYVIDNVEIVFNFYLHITFLGISYTY